MTLEVPLVASDLPVVRDAVGDPAGAILVPPERPLPLADAILAEMNERGATALMTNRTVSGFSRDSQ